MSGGDLNHIQAQLKVAIQSHQILVGRIKKEPENAVLYKQLHDLQSEITSLSEQQKSLIQMLRKELLHKQPVPVTSTTQSQVMKVGMPLVARSHLPPPQTTPTNLSTKPTPTNLSIKPIPTSLAPLKVIPQQLVTKPLPTNLSLKPQDCLATIATTNTVSLHLSPSPAALASRGGSPVSAHQHLAPVNNNNKVVGSPLPVTPCSPRSTSPPIRVPNYAAHRPSILPVKKELNGSRSTTPTKDVDSRRRPGILRAQNDGSLSKVPSSSPRKSPDVEVDPKQAIDKKDITPEEKKKLEYMAILDLVTPETLKELQNRRTERKRRSTANPQFSYGHFEPEPKRGLSYLSKTASLIPGVRKRGRPPKNGGTAASPAKSRSASPLVPAPTAAPAPASAPAQVLPMESDHAGDIHEDFCAVCQRSGEVLMCDTCSLVYHLNCLDPPITVVPQGHWSCPKCIAMGKTTNNWSAETLAVVHSYLAHKSAKEEEKRKLEKKAQELDGEKKNLELKAKQLTQTITDQISSQSDLLNVSKVTQQNVDKLKHFIKFFQSP